MNHYKSFIFGLLITLAFSVRATDLVSDGQMLRVLQDPSSVWSETAGRAVCQGVNNFLYGAQLVNGAADFTITAELSLDAFEGTAASLLIGTANFGLESSRGLFYERTDVSGSTVFFAMPASMKAGTLFTCSIVKTGLQAAFIINGETVGTVTLPEQGNVLFGLRPHRATMRVKELAITDDGALASSAGDALEKRDNVLQHRMYFTQRISTTPLSIAADQTLSFPYALACEAGSYLVRLRPLPAGPVAEATLTMNASGQLVLPAALLRQAFDASTLGKMLRPVQLELLQGALALRTRRLALYDPAATGDYPQGSIQVKDLRAEMAVDGQPIGTMTARMARCYGYNFWATPVRQFADAGINANQIIVNPYEFMTGDDFAFDQAAFLTDLQDFVVRTLAENPNATFQIFWQLMMPADWGDSHPDELIGLDNGVTTLSFPPEHKLQPSYASELWRQTAGKILADTVKAIAATPMADRIFALRVLYANCGEWNNWGYQEEAFNDFSLPMQKAFAAWLKDKYGTAAALQAAWGNTAVTFDSTDLVPLRAARLLDTGTFRMHGTSSQPTVDYYDFFQQVAAQTIEYFTRIAKQASNGRLLVGSYYAYYWNHWNSGLYHCQDSGNYGLKYLLDSKWIDFLGGPYPYESRRDGCHLNGAAKSLALHGKLWESEGDMRTNRAPESDSVYGRPDTLAESIVLAKRDYAMNRAAGGAYYFMDFVDDWYGDPEFMAAVASLQKIDAFLRDEPDFFRPQVAVILSEETLPHLSNVAVSWENMVSNADRGFNLYWGAPYDLYVEGDLANIDFDRYKVVVFADSYYASDTTIRLAHDRAMKNGRTVLFLYGAGFLAPDSDYDSARASEFTGITETIASDKSDTIVREAPDGSPYMNDTVYYPRVVVADSAAQIIARYDDGVAAGAQKTLADCRTAVVNHPAPNAAFMRDLFSKWGVTLYQAGTYVQTYFSGSMMTAYSRTAGTCQFQLPSAVEVVGDFFTRQTVAQNCSAFQLTFGADPEARMLFVGTRADWQKYLTGSACGTVQATITPDTAVWHLDGDAGHASGQSVQALAGTHTITFDVLENHVTPAAQTVTVAYGETTAITAGYTAYGTLTVKLTPDTAAWTVNGGAAHPSGASLALPPGNYAIAFQGVENFVTPDARSVAIVSGQDTALEVDYTAYGTLTVKLTPDTAAWTVNGGDARPSGASLALPPGDYTIRLADQTAYLTPAAQAVTLAPGEQKFLTIAYEPLRITFAFSPAAIPEDAGSATATLTRNAPQNALTVALHCDDAWVSAPATLDFAAGEAAAAFPVSSTDKGAEESPLPDGACGRLATFSATLDGISLGSGTLVLTDSYDILSLHRGWNAIAYPFAALGASSQSLAAGLPFFAYDSLNQALVRMPSGPQPGQACWVYCLTPLALHGTFAPGTDTPPTAAPQWCFRGFRSPSPVPGGMQAWQWTGGRFTPVSALLPYQAYWLLMP